MENLFESNEIKLPKGTNKVKHDYLTKLLEARAEKWLKWEFPEPVVGKSFYKRSGINAVRVEVTGILWAWWIQARDSKSRAWIVGDRVSNDEVKYMREFVESSPEVQREYILMQYKEVATHTSETEWEPRSIRCSGSFRIGKIGVEYFDSFEPLREEVEKAQYENVLRPGNFRCCRCRKQFPESQKVSQRIFGRDRKNVWNSWKGRYESKACVTETMMDFCSGTCAENEQMSREG